MNSINIYNLLFYIFYIIKIYYFIKMRLCFVVSIINIVNAATVHRSYTFLYVLKNYEIYKHKNVNVFLDYVFLDYDS